MSNQPTTDRLAEVLDCDRDSAADWLHDSGSLTWEGAGRIRRGEESHSLVELLVRHRVAATQSLSTDLDKAQQRIAELEADTSIFHIKIEQLISMVKPLVVMGDDDSIFLTERQLGFIDGVRSAAALNQPKESGND